MATTRDPQIEHLLRRAGFGARPDELDTYRADVVHRQAVNALVDYDRIPDDVDSQIGTAGLRRHDDQRRRVLAAIEHHATRASAGCSGWCTATVRSRRR